MTKFTDSIVKPGPAPAAPGGPARPVPDVEYDPFIDLEDIDEIAALMSQPPGNGREDDE